MELAIAFLLGVAVGYFIAYDGKRKNHYDPTDGSGS